MIPRLPLDDSPSGMGKDDYWTLYEARVMSNFFLKNYVSGFPPSTIQKSIPTTTPDVTLSPVYRTARTFFCNSPARDMFRRTARCFEQKRDLPTIISVLYDDLDQAVTKLRDRLKVQSVDLGHIPRFRSKNLHTDLSTSNNEIRDIEEIFHERSDLFFIAVMDGSIGSNDFRPGWSDIDIFCSLSKETLHSPDLLTEAREVIKHVNRKLYVYNILQLHKVFLSTEVDFDFYTPSVLPVVCLQNGALLTSHGPRLVLHSADDTLDVCNYFLKDIVQSSREINAIPDKNVIDKVLMFHRIYSFPFAFLQCMGFPVYKRESFAEISGKYGEEFPGIQDFYGRVNKLYLEWRVNSLKTIKLRRILSNLVHPTTLNKNLLRFERDIVARVERGYEALENGDLSRFLNFLEIAENRVRNRLATT